MTAELVALAEDRTVGHVRRDRRGRLSLIYDDRWRTARKGYPLSLSMPLAAREHGHTPIDAFLWGLLPDNDHVLERWARKFQVSPRSAFALISHVGEDCAGAIQFVRPGRVDTLLHATPEPIAWLDEQDVADRLRTLREDHAAGRGPGDTGQFSLAGAQPKTALLYENGRWGVPAGRTPTTHILKPPTGAFDGHAENEHFCLTLARHLGLPAASCRVAHIGEETALVVERYDRQHTDHGLVRVHQEDICQALSVPPTRKYQNEGGPGPREIAALLRDHSTRWEEDLLTFLDALIVNWLLAGTDAHAKNYALVIGAGGAVRLAPLYDVASALPYETLDPLKLKLAMKIGSRYRRRDIGLRDWQRLARDFRLDPDQVVGRARDYADHIADAATDVRDALRSDGLQHDIIERLTENIAVAAKTCAARITQAPNG
jgi:serine/threonine-protein kinase HipA